MARRSDTIGVTDATGSSGATSAVTVTSVATKLPATNLPNRKALLIQNNSSTKNIYVGFAGVTDATGIKIGIEASMNFDVSAGLQFYGICSAGETADVRTMEIDNG